MKANVGSVDRGLRIVGGLVVLSLYFVLGEGVRLFALLGLIPLVTGLLSWCPLYTLLGVRTCRMRTGDAPRKAREGWQ
jgi:lipopolysaccharide export LptBFGC system permease protein LptF